MIAAHQDYLRSAAYEDYTGAFFIKGMQGRLGPKKSTDEELYVAGVAWCQQEANMLNIASLFHVTDSMTEVAKIAGEKLPEDEVWTEEMLPAKRGVLVFEKPLEVMDAWNRVVTIAMITWVAVWAEKRSKTVIDFTYYTDMETEADDYNKIMKLNGDFESFRMRTGRMSMAHIDAHEIGGKVGVWTTEEDPEVLEYRQTHQDQHADDRWHLEPADPGTRPQFGNVEHVVFAIFALMSQTIVALSEETDHKLARRFRNKKRPPAMVTVIQLRRKEYHGYHDPGTGIWLNYRSMTRGHWRNQPYGPGRSEVKRIWVLAYWRGPEDAPIWQPKRVSTLAR
jgi:hypothetical protein